MKPHVYAPHKLFLFSALVLLCLGLALGLTASLYYVVPGLGKAAPFFQMLRPMHVSAVMFWILLGATGCVYAGLAHRGLQVSQNIARVQWLLWMIALAGIYYSYWNGQFGGREYWEFPPVWALPIAGAWLLFLVQFAGAARRIRRWPVYIWMWLTGIVFFLFSFTENYLWLLPYFREHLVSDTTIQWKANGSLVGAWNQLLYGTAFFLMERIGKNRAVGRTKMAFAMYFLGLSNLMFNWGHHIYTLPTDAYVRYTGYLVSMTEWIFFVRIIYHWQQSVSTAQKHYHYFPYRFLMAADIWVLLNLGQGILMSIPALNLYTHGTHVTVAHAMGTTIGINGMILLAAGFEFLGGRRRTSPRENQWLNSAFWVAQGALFVFWVSLNAAGIQKGIWQMSEHQSSFTSMMKGLRPWLVLFVVAGFVLAITLSFLAVVLLRHGLADVFKPIAHGRSFPRNVTAPHNFNTHEKHNQTLVDRTLQDEDGRIAQNVHQSPTDKSH